MQESLPKTHHEARALGLNLYFTGKPCKHGHIVPRRAANLSCSECDRTRARDRARLPHVKAMNKSNKQKPEYKEQSKAYSRSKIKTGRQNNPQAIFIPQEITGKERNAAYAKEYYKANRRELLAKAKSYAENPDKTDYIREYKRNWQNEKSKTPEGRARSFMRKCLLRCLHNKKDSTEAVLGYKRKELVERIESLFIKGMSWSNHGEWHIDHIKPIAAFIAEGNFDPKQINALSNLQPLWAKDNLSKGCKVI